MDLPTIQSKAARVGLAYRGAFYPDPADMVPEMPAGRRPSTVVLLGFTGRVGWCTFNDSTEARDGCADPLDRWSRRVVEFLAAEVGGTALFPFQGPPFLPFQQWAQRAEPVSASPLGILIHPDWGLWHSYRGALALPDPIELPQIEWKPSPCGTCSERPCLSACPVGAFIATGYDVSRCRDYLAEVRLGGCVSTGCLSRLACPVGRDHQYSPDQTAFHMRSFAVSVGAVRD
jgi:hypothetical protein